MSDIIQLIQDRGEFMMGEDGYIVYWPNLEPCKHAGGGMTSGGGAYSSAMLRVIADELDKRNASWDMEVQSYFSLVDQINRLWMLGLF